MFKKENDSYCLYIEEQYKAMVADVDYLSQEWIDAWTEACEVREKKRSHLISVLCSIKTMEAMEEDRVELIKYNVWEYANLASARLLIQDEVIIFRAYHVYITHSSL